MTTIMTPSFVEKLVESHGYFLSFSFFEYRSYGSFFSWNIPPILYVKVFQNPRPHLLLFTGPRWLFPPPSPLLSSRTPLSFVCTIPGERWSACAWSPLAQQNGELFLFLRLHFRPLPNALNLFFWVAENIVGFIYSWRSFHSHCAIAFRTPFRFYFRLPVMPVPLDHPPSPFHLRLKFWSTR